MAETDQMRQMGKDLDNLQKNATALASLLEDRQVGLSSWHMMLRTRIENMHETTSRVLGK